MNFITQVATLEHNIGYKKSSLLIKMFGTNLNIEKTVEKKGNGDGETPNTKGEEKTKTNTKQGL